MNVCWTLFWISWIIIITVVCKQWLFTTTENSGGAQNKVLRETEDGTVCGENPEEHKAVTCGSRTDSDTCSASSSSSCQYQGATSHSIDYGIGEHHENPASSCQELYEKGYSSGEYWIQVPNKHHPPKSFFCDMERECGGVRGAWMQIANLDMRNHTHKCPNNWREISSPKRTCGRTNEEGENGAGCSSAVFWTGGMNYTHVCGRVIGYQFCNTMAFWGYYHNIMESSIDEPFVDGVTISHGEEDNREHIWTFAGALHEGYKGRDTVCPCTRQHSRNKYRIAKIPPWVGMDYFCETGANKKVPPTSSRNCSVLYENVFYTDDPLWDGEGCSDTSTCCVLHGPPWFSKILARTSSSDNIEVRICGSGYTSFGNTPVETVEIYVHQ